MQICIGLHNFIYIKPVGLQKKARIFVFPLAKSPGLYYSIKHREKTAHFAVSDAYFFHGVFGSMWKNPPAKYSTFNICCSLFEQPLHVGFLVKWNSFFTLTALAE